MFTPFWPVAGVNFQPWCEVLALVSVTLSPSRCLSVFLPPLFPTNFYVGLPVWPTHFIHLYSSLLLYLSISLSLSLSLLTYGSRRTDLCCFLFSFKLSLSLLY